MIVPWSELKPTVVRVIARIRNSYLPRREKARQIKAIRRTVRWGRR